MKYAVIFLITILTHGCATLAHATTLEPLPERARVASMYTQLLLPDSSTLNVDMSFDCGAAFESTGLIVTSDAGAKLLAAAYTHLYGAEAGKYVLDKWYTKANPEDPRLPSFLIVKSQESQESQARVSKKGLSLSSSYSVSGQNALIKQQDYKTAVESHCGTRDHVYYDEK